MGDNTDGAGLSPISRAICGFDLADTRILLLGAGGAARGVLGPLLGASPEYIEIANRDGSRATGLAGEFSTLGEVTAAASMRSRTTPFDLVLNATAASLQETSRRFRPVDRTGNALLRHGLRQGRDGIHALVEERRRRPRETGWGMLVEQAAESFVVARHPAEHGAGAGGGQVTEDAGRLNVDGRR